MNWFGLAFSDYDHWKTTPPEPFPRQEDYCQNAECRNEAEYEGYCESCFALIEEARRLEGMQEIEWGNIEGMEDL